MTCNHTQQRNNQRGFLIRRILSERSRKIERRAESSPPNNKMKEIDKILRALETEYLFEAEDCLQLSIQIKREDNIVSATTEGYDTGISYQEWDTTKIDLDKLTDELGDFLEEVISDETKIWEENEDTE